MVLETSPYSGLMVADPVRKWDSGGCVSVARVGMHIRNEYRDTNFLTTLVDYYGFQNIDGRSKEQLKDSVLSEAKTLIGERFDAHYIRPYVQMYEFEGLLFSDISKFELHDNLDEEAGLELQRVYDIFETPEHINDDEKTAPSKRLDEILPGYAGNKTLYGPLIAMAKPPGLWKRGKVWQYRVWIPMHLRHRFRGNEINRSLKTTSYREAINRSKSLAYEIDVLFGSYDDQRRFNGLSVPIPTSRTAIVKEVLSTATNPSEASKTVTGFVTETVTGSVTDEHSNAPEPVTLNDIFKMYMADPKHDRSPKTDIAYESTFSLLAKMIGTETRIADIDRKTCRNIQSMLMGMPPNASKRFPNLSIEQVIQTASERNLPTLAPKSVNKHMGLLSTLIRWGEQSRFCQSLRLLK